MTTFISFKHDEAWWEKDQVKKYIENNTPHYDNSVDAEIDERGKTDEQIRQHIRDKYVKDADVIVVLATRDAKNRKFIDWEIAAGMYDGKINSACGIVVIDFVGNNMHTSSEILKTMYRARIGGTFTSITQSRIRNKYDYLPTRIIESLVTGASIDVIPGNDWKVYISDAISHAGSKRRYNSDNNLYDNSKLRKRNNNSLNRFSYY